MELRHLRYFIKSAELLHFTKAAEALHVSQPTLSAQIHQLEEELGTTLFDRKGRQVRLTYTGELFLDHARRALLEVEAGQQGIQDWTGLLRGDLRIGVTYSYSSRLVPRILAEFLRRHPAVRVHVSTSTNEGVRGSVSAGDLDLGLVCLPPDFAGEGTQAISSANSRRLFEDRIVAVLSKGHCLAASRGLRLTDLEGVQLALPTSKFNSRCLIDSAFAAAEVQPRILLESDDIPLLLGLARLRVATTLVPSQAAAHVSLDEVSVICLLEESLRLTAAIIWPPGRNASPAVERLTDVAVALAGQIHGPSI
jgi:LysR family cyn operon transcriptional activator